MLKNSLRKWDYEANSSHCAVQDNSCPQSLHWCSVPKPVTPPSSSFLISIVKSGLHMRLWRSRSIQWRMWGRSVMSLCWCSCSACPNERSWTELCKVQNPLRRPLVKLMKDGESWAAGRELGMHEETPMNREKAFPSLVWCWWRGFSKGSVVFEDFWQNIQLNPLPRGFFLRVPSREEGYRCDTK